MMISRPRVNLGLLLVLVAGALAFAAPRKAGAAAKIKIAAVGASTTLGSGSTAGHHFPDELGRLLGVDYDVKNYGVSSAGVLRKAMVSYWDTKEFAAAKALLPDLVVLWLGGSDTKPENWEANQASFLPDMLDMIHTFQGLASHPKVVVMLSVAYHDASGVRKTLVEGEVQPRQRMAAAMTGSLLVDLQAAVAGHGEYFPDGIHPNDAGTLAIAKAAAPVVLAALMGTGDAGAPPAVDAGVGDAAADPAGRDANPGADADNGGAAGGGTSGAGGGAGNASGGAGAAAGDSGGTGSGGSSSGAGRGGGGAGAGGSSASGGNPSGATSGSPGGGGCAIAGGRGRASGLAAGLGLLWALTLLGRARRRR